MSSGKSFSKSGSSVCFLILPLNFRHACVKLAASGRSRIAPKGKRDQSIAQRCFGRASATKTSPQFYERRDADNVKEGRPRACDTHRHATLGRAAWDRAAQAQHASAAVQQTKKQETGQQSSGRPTDQTSQDTTHATRGSAVSVRVSVLQAPRGGGAGARCLLRSGEGQHGVRTVSIRKGLTPTMIGSARKLSFVSGAPALSPQTQTATCQSTRCWCGCGVRGARCAVAPSKGQTNKGLQTEAMAHRAAPGTWCPKSCARPQTINKLDACKRSLSLPRWPACQYKAAQRAATYPSSQLVGDSLSSCCNSRCSSWPSPFRNSFT